MESPILITGIQRSGAGIVARSLAHCGAFAGGISSDMRHRGISALTDECLEFLGVDKKGQGPLPNLSQLPRLQSWTDVISTPICADGYQQGPWMYKDHRTFQLWRMWGETFPGAKWIIVRRRSADVIGSCLKTAYMDAHTTREGWLAWIHEQEGRLSDLMTSGADYREVWPERFENDEFLQLRELIEWCGLEWRPSVKILISEMLNTRQE